MPCPEGPAFTATGTAPALHGVYDALLGPGRWIRREGVEKSARVACSNVATSHPPIDWSVHGSFAPATDMRSAPPLPSRPREFSAFPDGERDAWENSLFGGAYHADGVTNSERPKYGALELVH